MSRPDESAARPRERDIRTFCARKRRRVRPKVRIVLDCGPAPSARQDLPPTGLLPGWGTRKPRLWQGGAWCLPPTANTN